MLAELVVENFAVVERLRLQLHPGLNALTGETGSGKSLIVDALGLLFGGRASTDLIRTGAPRAFVSAIFELPSDPALANLLDQAGIVCENGDLIIEREILPTGKSRAWVASRPATAALLKDIAPFLGDIHGQHDQQKLFSPDSQRELLDEAARAHSHLDATAAAYHQWRAAQSELASLDRAQADRLRLADLWSMQRKEIESLSLSPGEDTQLENEKRVLRNVARLSDAATAAYDALSESDSSAARQLSLALKRLDEIARIDESLSPLLESLKPAHIAVQEASFELRDYLGRLEADPNRLETVETRLAQIEKLKRKYGTSIDEILAFLADVTARLSTLEDSAERRAALAAEIARLEAAYRAEAEKLRALRLKSARKLERQVTSELAHLAMPGVGFKISITPSEPASHGLDEVRFLVSANTGEDLRPLDKVASGGEISRIALALKTCVIPETRSAVARTLVFDEVDSGIGGAAGESVGRRLQSIAASNQVLCVTHLAQIAGFADHHFVVSKREASGRTLAEVAPLSPDDRVTEIARMISGKRLSGEALTHARQLVTDYARRP